MPLRINISLSHNIYNLDGGTIEQRHPLCTLFCKISSGNKRPGLLGHHHQLTLFESQLVLDRTHIIEERL